MISDLRKETAELIEKVDQLSRHLGIEKLKKKKIELEAKTSSSGFWDDPSGAQKLMQELKLTSGLISSVESLSSQIDDLLGLIDLSAGEDEKSVEDQLKKELETLTLIAQKLELSTLLSGEHDKDNAILSINAGAGGTDAQDWAQILLRMYSRWAEEKGYEAEIADMSYGEQAGIKNAVVFIRAPYAYGYLKSESGVHRLVRMSPFNSDGKRHTSFAAIEVIPETGEELTVDIRSEDLRIDTFRSSGPGGQNVNKTSSAIRITHIPTGIVTQSQASPSQHRNKELAMKLLISRLKERLEKEQKQKIEDLKGEQKQIAWGSQIRSYVFAPYQLVKDHRTGAETGNVNKVIDGDIDIFIEAYLKSTR